MEPLTSPNPLLRFGVFELNLKTGELHKGGTRINLQPQASKVLALLASRAGQVITRQEIEQHLWGDKTTFVDFNQGVNFAISRIRAVLGDDAETPRYVETLSRRGYRFISPVQKRRLMLAVLPFQNLNHDPEQDYFSDGLTEEMITQLARLYPQRLGVIARTSIMKYKSTEKSAHEIGQELGVDYILEGSVRRSGQRVRVAAQLISVSDETHLWAEAFERHLRDVLASQNDIAQAIASGIGLKLTPEEQARLACARPINPEAHEAYLRGLHQFRKLTREGAEKAIAHFQEAVRKDAGYALAYVGLTEAYIALTTFYLSPLEIMPKAKAAAMKAVELDENLAEAHASLGLVKLFFDWDWAGSENEFKRALALNSNLVEAHIGYAGFLTTQGRQEEAFLETRKAQELDPLPVYSRGEGLWHFYAFRQYEESIQQCQKAAELEPNFFLSPCIMAWALVEQGRFAEAIVAAERARQLSDSPFALTGLGFVYAKAGDKHKADRIVQELKELSRQRYVCAYQVAVVYAALGEKEHALDWLDKAYSERSD